MGPLQELEDLPGAKKTQLPTPGGAHRGRRGPTLCAGVLTLANKQAPPGCHSTSGNNPGLKGIKKKHL